MELKQLEAYIHVYELKSFSRAAQVMFLSQPSISAYISALEKELQRPLIYRSTKAVVPTKAGALFYEYAKEMLALRDQSIHSLSCLSDFRVGSIDILASSVPVQHILPEVLGAFHHVYPGIVFNVEQADTAAVIEGISALRSEIGFVGTKITAPKCLYEDFMSEKLVMIAPNEERFAKMNANDIGDLLRHEYFVMRGAGSGTRLEYEEYLKRINVKFSELKISAYFNNTQSIIYAVASGLGLSIVSELAARHYIQQKMVIPIYIDSLPERQFYTVMKKKGVVSAQVEIFREFIHSYYRQ